MCKYILVYTCTLWCDNFLVFALFFRHLVSCSPDPSDVDLRTALVHMVAVTIGCSPRNTHLWYHMFGIKELVGTYLTGFMVRPIPPQCYLLVRIIITCAW